MEDSKLVTLEETVQTGWKGQGLPPRMGQWGWVGPDARNRQPLTQYKTPELRLKIQLPTYFRGMHSSAHCVESTTPHLHWAEEEGVVDVPKSASSLIGMRRRLAVLYFFALTDASSVDLNVTASLAGPTRPSPIAGFGTEFVFQTNSDTSLNSNLVLAGSQMCRYPGGTPSDYWLWELGWVNVTSDHSGSSKLPFRPTTPSELHSFLEATAQQTCVMVVNQLQTSLSYQLAGLAAHAQAGTPVTHIELGNEMYDATRPDVVAAYPEPSDYAEKMSGWTAAIKSAFPGAKVALDGLANTWDTRTEAWNGQVLQNAVSSEADAATVHLYPGLPATLPTPETYAALLAVVFSSVDGCRSYIASSIPARMEVWVTEWGTWGNANITNTWLQGLWHGALVALLPTIPPISVILPYCATCADPNMPSFWSQVCLTNKL